MKSIHVNATSLARHLGLSRQFIDRLADDCVIERHDDGYDLDQSRLKYLAWLRDPQRRSARAEANAQLRLLKAQALQLKIAVQLGELMEVAEHTEILEEVVGLFRSELACLPARLTRDLQERRRIEQTVNEVLQRISDRAAEKANSLPPKIAVNSGSSSCD